MSYALGFSPEKRIAAFVGGEFVLDTESLQAQGLVGWWPLGVHGGKSKDWDYSLFDNHGIRTNGPTRKVVNHPQWGGVQVLDFDGVDEYVDLGSNVFATGSENRTVTLWLNSRDLSAASFVFTLGTNSSGQAWRIHTTAAGNLRIAIEGSGYESSLSLTANQLMFVAVVLDGTTLGDHILYLDRQSENATGAGSVNTSSSEAFIGEIESSHPNFGSGLSFDGFINDVRIYNRTLVTGLIAEINNEPWRMVYPLGVRTISFAPVVGTRNPLVMGSTNLLRGKI